VLHEFCFDTNLKRWGFMEDLNFSYRVYKKYPQSLYAVPSAKIIHKASKEARMPNRTSIYMTTIYWFYVFFKDVFENSVLNLIAFLWALTGNLVAVTGGLIVKRKPKHEWWTLIYLLKSYITAFRNLRNILMHRLEFFNKKLK
jgi:glucosyl-dolichyl phosphate glucuronosyltransferase